MSQLITHSHILPMTSCKPITAAHHRLLRLHPPPEASGNTQWSEADEIALIEYITEHKAEAGDGMKFKASFWSGAAKEMLLHSTLGGVKTSQGCSGKWDQVHTKLSILLLTHIDPPQLFDNKGCPSPPIPSSPCKWDVRLDRRYQGAQGSGITMR